MGYNVNEGYYEKHVKQKGYKITDEQEKFNLADLDDVRTGIKIATAQLEKDMKNISNVHLKDGNLDISKIQLNKKDTVKEEQDNEMEL